jgi:hypothetical protein
MNPDFLHVSFLQILESTLSSWSGIFYGERIFILFLIEAVPYCLGLSGVPGYILVNNYQPCLIIITHSWVETFWVIPPFSALKNNVAWGETDVSLISLFAWCLELELACFESCLDVLESFCLTWWVWNWRRYSEGWKSLFFFWGGERLLVYILIVACNHFLNNFIRSVTIRVLFSKISCFSNLFRAPFLFFKHDDPRFNATFAKITDESFATDVFRFTWYQ